MSDSRGQIADLVVGVALVEWPPGEHASATDPVARRNLDPICKRDAGAGARRQ